MIRTREEALKLVDTEVRKYWEKWIKKNELPNLGEAYIDKEVKFSGHKAWSYHIYGLPMSRDGRIRWLVDTGETVDTTLAKDEDSPKKAYAKLLAYKAVAAQDESIKSLPVQIIQLEDEPEYWLVSPLNDNGKSLVGAAVYVVDVNGYVFKTSNSLTPKARIQAAKDQSKGRGL